MKNVAIRLTDHQADKLTKGYKSLHAYARGAIDGWAAVREETIKNLRRKGWTSEQREALRALRPPRGAGRAALMAQAADTKSLHAKLMTITEVEAVVLADLIRSKQTIRLVKRSS